MRPVEPRIWGTVRRVRPRTPAAFPLPSGSQNDAPPEPALEAQTAALAARPTEDDGQRLNRSGLARIEAAPDYRTRPINFSRVPVVITNAARVGEPLRQASISP